MAIEPNKWDYTLAGVPSPLTDELESQQLAKQVGSFLHCLIVFCHRLLLHHPISPLQELH